MNGTMEQLDEWILELLGGWNVRMDGWMDGWNVRMDGRLDGWMHMVITIPKVVTSEHFPKCCAQHMQPCFATFTNTSLFSSRMLPQAWVDLPELAPRWQITER